MKKVAFKLINSNGPSHGKIETVIPKKVEITMESRFFEPPRETEISSKNRDFEKSKVA